MRLLKRFEPLKVCHFGNNLKTLQYFGKTPYNQLLEFFFGVCWKSLSHCPHVVLADLPMCWWLGQVSKFPLSLHSLSCPPAPASVAKPFLWTAGKWTFWFVLKPDTNIQCSVSSEDIENSFKANPCGSISFTTSKFSYRIDFAGMFSFPNSCVFLVCWYAEIYSSADQD